MNDATHRLPGGRELGRAEPWGEPVEEIQLAGQTFVDGPPEGAESAGRPSRLSRREISVRRGGHVPARLLQGPPQGEGATGLGQRAQISQVDAGDVRSRWLDVAWNAKIQHEQLAGPAGYGLLEVGSGQDRAG